MELLLSEKSQGAWFLFICSAGEQAVEENG